MNWKSLAAWDELVFPKVEFFRLRPSVVTQGSLVLGLAIIFSALGRFLPEDGFFAFDWVHYFGRGRIPPFYPPWIRYVVAHLTWPALVGITVAAVILAILKRSVHPLSAVCALLALPVFWAIFIGQLEGLAVLGLLGLPWLAPLALAKPQIAIFAFGARRSHLLVGLILLGVSFLVWGVWPLTFQANYHALEEGRYAQDIALSWWGAPLALPLLWRSRGDMDMLMAAGAFMAPHVIPFNFLVIVPAIARLQPGMALVACVLSWLPLSANWIGPMGWWLGWLFVLWLWVQLAVTRYARKGEVRP